MSIPTKYMGPAPDKHLSEFAEEICEAGTNEVFDIVAWIDDIDPNVFMIGERYSFAILEKGHHITATGIVQEGTMVGNYPDLFEGGPRWFVRLLLKVVDISSTPDLKIV